LIVFSFYGIFFELKSKSIPLKFEQSCKISCCCSIWSVFTENNGTHLCVVPLVKYKSMKVVPNCTKVCCTNFALTVAWTCSQHSSVYLSCTFVHVPSFRHQNCVYRQQCSVRA